MTAVLASLIMFVSAVARAERPGEPNIPAQEQKATESPVPVGPSRAGSDPSELPLPYAPWQGTSYGLPAADARDGEERAMPLARPRQRKRRRFEAAAGLAALLPHCGSGSIDDRGCLTVGAGSGVELVLLYRVGPFFAVGAEGVWGGFGRGGHAAISRSGGGSRFLGLVGRVYFADEGSWDPYLALTLGTGALDLEGQEPGAARASTTGFGGRVQAGIDYAFGSQLRFGPAASFAHWLAWSEKGCSSDICREAPALFGKLVGFASLGLRVTGSFGEVL